jgi:hypothetical protein
MIDWPVVALNAVWVFGLAIILAAFSYHHWLAAETPRDLREALSEPSWKLSLSIGLLLTCVGVGYGVVHRWWERTAWTALALACAYQLAMDLRRR